MVAMDRTLIVIGIGTYSDRSIMSVSVTLSDLERQLGRDGQIFGGSP